ncbi:MAG: hypothetical protein AAGF12_25425 [Myxococcota bacterium]
MTRFTICEGCHRHIRPQQPCPFCRPILQRSTSRGRALALGAALALSPLTGCGGDDSPEDASPADATPDGPVADAAGDASEDAMVDATRDAMVDAMVDAVVDAAEDVAIQPPYGLPPDSGN